MTDHSVPLEVPTVEILCDGELVATGQANLFRQDLLDAGIGVGNHGFDITLPENIFDGAVRQITARSKRHGSILQGSPKRINVRLVSTDALAQSTFQKAIEGLEYRLSKLETALQEQNTLLRAVHSALSGTPASQSETPQRGDFFDACRSAIGERGDLLVFSIIDWTFRNQRPQHLSRGLGSLGYRVLYLSVQFDSDTSPGYSVISNLAENVFEVRLKIPGERPSIYSGFSDASQLKDVILAVEHLIKDTNVRRPYALIQFPTWLPVAQSIQGATIVHDCLDHVAGFSNVSKEVAELELELVKEADIVATTSAYLHDYVAKFRPSTIIRNGCEFDYFSKKPTELAVIEDRPVIGYFGAIAEWFDVELVSNIARRHADWDFVFIGSTAGCDISEISKMRNVRFLGEKPYSDLTKYLYGFSVCTIPFKIVELIKATNPVKLYEYMASGKPVVCTDIPEAHLAPADLVRIAKDEEEFESALVDAIAEGDDHELASRRRHWASENSWHSRASQYAELLQTYHPKVSVVVLTYNGIGFTKACLHSLEQFSDYPNLEIICVDNMSTDGSRDFLREWGESGSNRKVILNEQNLGFAAGNNVGIDAATGEIIILLNNDTYVTTGWIQDLIRPLVHDHSIGLAGPVTNMIGGIQKISIHYADMTEMAYRSREFTRSRRGSLYEADTVAFFCVATRRDVIEKIGGLDASYGVGFFEDDDYCQRVRQAGYRIVCVDGVFVHHHLSAAFNMLEYGVKGELFRKNRAIYEARWGKWVPHKYREAPGFGE
ncbi:MAG: glycosyltransferase [Alphaproteobacteria bacterium]|nr:glycosyltransferase [Alphaproteobacteria bacterium]